MKHLEPTPKLPKLKPQNKATLKKRPSLLFAMFAAVIMVAGAGFGMSALWSGSGADHLSKETRDKIYTNYSPIKRFQMERLSSPQVAPAIAALPISADQKQQLMQSLADNQTMLSHQKFDPQARTPPNKLTLIWLDLYDFADEDGDAVHLSTAGFEMDVPLKHDNTRIAVPVDQSGTVKVTGALDGGGGITLGIKSFTGPVYLPVMAVGQSISLNFGF